MSHALSCRLAHKPGAVDLDPCTECSAQSHSQTPVGVVSRTPVVSQPEKHDPLCRWVNVPDLARHDCGLCILIAAVRADERDESGRIP